MMGKIAFFGFIILMLTEITCYGQGVGIGTLNVHAAAALQINAVGGNAGVLIPKMTTASRDAIAGLNPDAEGLLIYNTTDHNFQVYGHDPNVVGGGYSWQYVGMPKGAIIMWSGTTPPPGWTLCTGGNNTPDLRGRFIVAYSDTDVTYGNPGNRSQGGVNQGTTGGAATVALTVGQMPSHTHGINIQAGGAHTHNYSYPNGKKVGKNAGDGEDAADNGAWTDYPTTEAGNHSHQATADPNGSSDPIDIRPPFYVLAFIMKL